MQITDEFTLDLPPQDTYELLLDLERVTPCMPGASLGDELDDGSRAVNVKVKLGPMRFTYGGTVRISEQDADARRAVLQGNANEMRGQGSAAASIAMQVHETAGGSRVTATADIDLTGRAAQMGHGVVEGVTKQLIGQMTQCLSERFVETDPHESPALTQVEPEEGGSVATAPAAPGPRIAAAPTSAEPRPLKATSLLWAVLRARIAGLFRRGNRGTA